ncbi:MAG: hypothetical protein WCW61_03635 [Patescibacteria group bacterium]|jgi:hypothetical protein
MNNQEILMKYAEEVAYSSKGHYKTASWIKTSLNIYILLPITLSVILIIFPDSPQLLSRLLNCFIFIFSILALTSPLVSNQEQAVKTISSHMTLGNEYLSIYKEIRNISAESQITKEIIDNIYEKVKSLDEKTSNLRISFAGRVISKCLIKKEMDLDWIYK